MTMETNTPSPITRRIITVGEPEKNNDNIICGFALIIFALFVFAIYRINYNTIKKEKSPLIQDAPRVFNTAKIDFSSFIFPTPVPTKPADTITVSNKKYFSKYISYPGYSVYDTIIAKEAATIKVKPAVIKAIIEQESHYRPDVKKYESKWEYRYSADIPKQPNESRESRKLNFSSIGLMQIGYALHKDFCYLNSPYDLFDPATNIKCGVKLFGRCLDSGSSEAQCIKQHNGSGPMAENYKNEVLGRVARLMNDISKAIS